VGGCFVSVTVVDTLLLDGSYGPARQGCQLA
jgi:hypothetical protein